MNLTRLLKPQSIAVIGGGVWGRASIQQALKLGFSGSIYPIHPTANEIAGLVAYRSLADLPEAPDASFIGINREATVESVRQLGEIGAGGAVCFASGFAEASAELDGAGDLQVRLLEAAGDMPILGPNCYGFLNLVDRVCLWPDQHGAAPCDRGVAILTQSSNIAINLTMQMRGLPIAYVITIGNQAQISLPMAAMAVLEDPRVTALGLHIEGFSDLEELYTLAARAQDLQKPIIGLKVGASQQAQTATVSHTASLAGSDVGATAFMQRLAIIRVATLAEFLETLKIAHLYGALPSHTVASASCSGGEASLMADLGQAAGLSFPPLTAAQKSSLRSALGPAVALANPLDYHTYIWGHVDQIEAMIDGLVADHLALTLVVLDFPRSDHCSDAGWELVVEAAHRVQKRRGVRLAILASLPETMPEGWAQKCLELGVLPLCGMAEGLAAVRYAADLGGMTVANRPSLHPPCHEHQEAVLVPEAEAKAELAAAGLMVPKGQIVTSISELSRLDVALPWVMKATGLAHKSDSGGVVLGIETLTAAQNVFAEMPSEHVLVETMVSDTIAELLVGVILDPAHGFVMTIGAGGILTELLRDTVSLLIPSSRQEMAKHIARLNVAPLLTGYRGRAAANMKTILDALMAVQHIVINHQDTLIELEINPLLVTPHHTIAVDALIRRLP